MLTVRVRGGELEPEPWVYAWVAPHGVIYVGATALHPATRTWLHLSDEDPNVGRLRARYPAHADEELDVLAVPLEAATDRQQARHDAVRLLAVRGLLSERHVCDPPGEGEPTAESEALVEAIAEWLGQG